MSNIKMYWWNDQPNFGDALNPYLVEKLSNRKVEWSPLESADIVGAGSLLQWVAKIEDRLARPLHVWGSGYMFDQEAAISSVMVKHHAVRGRKTKEYGHIRGAVLGDTGLLADLLTIKPIAKRYEIGIVPHLWHIDNPALGDVLSNYPNMKLIDVRINPLEVIKQIAQCEFILSSSLHGLIVADSFGIPNQWVQFDVPLFGGDWKFEDYYSVFDLEPKPFVVEFATQINDVVADCSETYFRSNIQDIKKRLLDNFPL